MSAYEGLMMQRKSSLTLKSFQDLKALLENKSLSFPKQGFPKCPDPIEKESPEMEKALFIKEMRDVVPISRKNFIERIFQVKLPESSREKEDAEMIERLKDLVRYGRGFNVANTPEYIEGTNYCIHPSVAKRLHRGDYSIQAFVDLHGLIAEEAREVFDTFLKWAVMNGKTGVLIVHGRGLSSPLEPVLKKKVVEWLTRGFWRKWVVAYSSARICDGGAGATYVLLRPRALSKKRIKKPENKKS